MGHVPYICWITSRSNIPLPPPFFKKHTQHTKRTRTVFRAERPMDPQKVDTSFGVFLAEEDGNFGFIVPLWSRYSPIIIPLSMILDDRRRIGMK